MIYEIIGIIWAIALVWCMWGFFIAPTYPADWNEKQDEDEDE